MNLNRFSKITLLCLLGLTGVARADYNANDDAASAFLQTYYGASAAGMWDGGVGWGDACSLEAIENTIQRTNGQSYPSVLATTYSNGNSGQPGFIDYYYDDEGWWCNAWIRAYDLTGNTTYLNMAKSIFSDIAGGWGSSNCGGGLWWNKADSYKSAISNELFLLEAVRLHQRTPGDTTYLNWATSEWNWFNASGVINGQNLINDGLDLNTCANNNGGEYSYNQGVVLAGLVDLYKVTLNTTYLTKAETIANAVIANLVNSNGILQAAEGSNPGGDGAEFRGIFMRYLFYLYDEDHNPAYYNFLSKNAQSIWNNDRSGSALGSNWSGPFDAATAGNQTSGMPPSSSIADPWTSTMVFARGAGDPEFNHSTGYTSGTLAWACDLTSSPTSTFMQWGPYVSYLQAGSHTVHFRLAAASVNCSPVSLVTLQITSASGTNVLATVDVPWAAFAEAGKAQDFAVSYTDNTANDALEFRVVWNAAAGSPKVTLSDITVDGNYNWTAANLTHAIGRLDGVNNWEADSVKDSASGYMIQGPGTAELGNASCQATFELKVDNFGYDSNQVATLSVVDVDTGTTAATQNITRNQFTSILFQNFSINFTAQLGHHYDYRVYYDVFNNSPRLTARGVYTKVLSTNAVPTPTSIACSSSGTFGNTASGTGGYNLGGQLDCAKYTLSQAMTVTSMQIYMGSGTTGSGVLGIYSDNSGAIGTLLVQSAAQPLFTGWNVFGVASTVLAPGTYWLSGSFTGTCYYDYSNTNGGTLGFLSYAYSGTLPCSVGSTTGYGWLMSIYASGCVQPTPTKTYTPTFTTTATFTPTASATKTATSTVTLTKTFTPTSTYSSTSTATATFTPSLTPTSSATFTSTSSLTSTATKTFTSTFTWTPSPTGTPTATLTKTFTSTFTNSPSGTPTAVNTATATFTSTSTPTASPTSTRTVTSTLTYTFSPTASFTKTPTTLNTATNTFSPTKTPTSTFTVTKTVTSTTTASATKTFTVTLTPTFTFTKTLTPTTTWTYTNTFTFTPVPTKTFTPTFTATPTAACSGVPAWNGNFVAYAAGQNVFYNNEVYQCIQSHVSEPNWMPPVVPALWRAMGACGSTLALTVAAPVVFPNPATTDSTNVELSVVNSSDVTIEIYTVAMRQVRTLYVAQVMGNIVTVQLLDKAGIRLADGLYYFTIKANGQKWMSKVLVLR